MANLAKLGIIAAKEIGKNSGKITAAATGAAAVAAPAVGSALAAVAPFVLVAGAAYGMYRLVKWAIND